MEEYVLNLNKYMIKQDTQKLIDAFVKDFIDVCPHCEARAHLTMLFSESHWSNNDLVYYIIFRCVPCKGLVLKTYRFKQNVYRQEEDLKDGGWEGKFPQEEFLVMSKFQGIVPDDVFEDFKEGVISLLSNCPRAAVAMFRRSLQSSVLNLGAKPEEDLMDQIKNLSGLTQDIRDWAHNIRIFGNWGVHPQDDDLKDVDSEKGKETQSFLEEFFNYVYVMPKRVAKARGVKRPAEEEPTPDA